MTNRIIQGDCLEVMKQLPDKSVDLILTDPPYGIKRDEGFEGFGGFGTPIARRRYEGDKWDDKIPSKECFDEIFRASRNQIITGGNYFAHILPQSTYWIVWDKLNTMPTFGDCELIWTSIDRKSVKKFTHQYNGLIGKEQERFHPTQKPLALMLWLIEKYSKPTDLILDPFCGSGTTCVATKMLGRRYIGIELSEKYCEISRRRLNDTVYQPSMFEDNRPIKKQITQKGMFEK